MKKRSGSIAIATFCFFVLSAFAVLTLHPVNSDNAVTFSIKNFGIDTKGELKGLKGNIQWNEEDIAASTFSVSADVNTINTGIDGRDNHLKKEEYFDADKYPVISFSSTSITGSNGTYTMTGNLVIKGVTKNVSFPFTATKTGNGYIFKGSFTINRRDFSVGKNSMVLSDDTDIKLNVQAVQ